MTFRRVPKSADEVLPAGLYELVATVTRGDAGSISRVRLEAALRVVHGPRVVVSDYQVRNGALIIRFEILEAGVVVQPAGWVIPLAITGAAILTTLWLAWRVSTELVELVQLVAEAPPATQAFVVVLGLVVLAALISVMRPGGLSSLVKKKTKGK